jgi:hypothetical protein
MGDTVITEKGIVDKDIDMPINNNTVCHCQGFASNTILNGV